MADGKDVINITQGIFIIFEPILFNYWSMTNVWICLGWDESDVVQGFARWAWNVAPELLQPYSGLWMNIIVPASDPNSGPARVQIFSRQSAVKYAF